MLAILGFPLEGYFRPGAVTLAAEVGSLFRGETDQLVQVFWRRRVVIAGQHRCQVRVDCLMTVPALHPWSQFVQGELLSLHGIRSVASKAVPLVIMLIKRPAAWMMSGGTEPPDPMVVPRPFSSWNQLTRLS